MVEQISIFLENRAGQLSEITDILFKNNIDIRALFIAETENYGILRIIVNEPKKALEILSQNNMLTSSVGVTAVSVPDEPGGLGGVLKILAENGIDISYMYSVFGRDDKKAHMVFKVHDTERLEKVLEENNIKSETIDDLI